jgi:hypothetical protein
MKMISRTSRPPLATLASICLLLLACAALTSIAAASTGTGTATNSATDTTGVGSGQSTTGEGTQTKANPSATLEECLTVGAQTERAATFAGEMASIPGTVRMEMRISVLEMLPHEGVFHAVIAPGLGVWRRSAVGVKTYTYLKQVTNLAAPAIYRGAVQFRWVNAKGHIIKSAAQLTTRCRQPLTVKKTETAPESEPASKSTTETSAGSSTGAAG